jgi:hypothetical protein
VREYRLENPLNDEYVGFSACESGQLLALTGNEQTMLDTAEAPFTPDDPPERAFYVFCISCSRFVTQRETMDRTWKIYGILSSSWWTTGRPHRFPNAGSCRAIVPFPSSHPFDQQGCSHDATLPSIDNYTSREDPHKKPKTCLRQFSNMRTKPSQDMSAAGLFRIVKDDCLAVTIASTM